MTETNAGLPPSYTLELVPADEKDPDPAELSRIGQQVVEKLQREGWTITRPYTGKRGGEELLLQLMNQGLQVIEADIVAQQVAIGILANLCTIFATLLIPVQLLFQAHQQASSRPQVAQPQQATAEAPINISLTIDGATITLTPADVAGEERAMQLAERFLREHPAVKVTPQSKVTVKARVPKRNRPRRR